MQWASSAWWVGGGGGGEVKHTETYSNQDWVGITCAGEPLYSASFVYCICLSCLSVES